MCFQVSLKRSWKQKAQNQPVVEIYPQHTAQQYQTSGQYVQRPPHLTEFRPAPLAYLPSQTYQQASQMWPSQYPSYVPSQGNTVLLCKLLAKVF